MSVLTEERLIQLMGETVQLQAICLDQLIVSGTRPVDPELFQRYSAFIHSIEAEKPREATLGESVWDWIWQPAEGINYIQMYGRLAWINMQLLDLL